MGAKQVTVLLMVFFSFCSPSSFPSVSLQENDVKDKETNEQMNFARGVNGGGAVNGGQSGGKGENGNGGGTKSPYVPAGTAVIPLYTAGAAGSHRNHHNAAVGYRSCIGFRTVAAAILALFLVHTCLVF